MNKPIAKGHFTPPDFTSEHLEEIEARVLNSHRYDKVEEDVCRQGQVYLDFLARAIRAERRIPREDRAQIRAWARDIVPDEAQELKTDLYRLLAEVEVEED